MSTSSFDFSTKVAKLNIVREERRKLRSIPQGARHTSSYVGFIAIVYAIMLIALSITPANAQTFTGTISGRVTDQTGAGIPGASVVLTAVGTSQSRTTQSNDQGEYTFTSLQPGRYKIDVSAPNFTSETITTELAVAQQLRADVALGVGQLASRNLRHISMTADCSRSRIQWSFSTLFSERG